MSEQERPNVAAFRELETVVRRLVDELSAFRKRAISCCCLSQCAIDETALAMKEVESQSDFACGDADLGFLDFAPWRSISTTDLGTLACSR